jgi:uncharacterized protein (DUF433 family)
VFNSKPARRSGDDLRDLPTYTIPEAALSLGMSERTMTYWYSDNPILKPSAYYGNVALLSFRDLAEAYVLTVLTKFYNFNLKSLRQIVKNAKKETGLERPLIEARLSVLFKNLVLEKPARGRRARQMVDLAHDRNLVFPELVDQLGRRIMRDKDQSPRRLYPWRLVRPGDESRPVSMDPEVVSGRLVVTGTRVPVRILLGKKLSGRSLPDIAKSYHLSVETVQKALQHIERPLHQKAA